MAEFEDGNNSGKDTRYKPGESGNPNGRPKGSQNFKTIIKRMMEMELEARTIDNTIAKQKGGEAVVASMASKAIHDGDVSAARLLIEQLDGKPLQKTQEVPRTLADALEELPD